MSIIYYIRRGLTLFSDIYYVIWLFPLFFLYKIYGWSNPTIYSFVFIGLIISIAEIFRFNNDEIKELNKKKGEKK